MSMFDRAIFDPAIFDMAAIATGGPALYPKRHWLDEASVGQRRLVEATDEEAAAWLLLH